MFIRSRLGAPGRFYLGSVVLYTYIVIYSCVLLI